MSHSNKPILIVGAGIAGLSLAFQLERRNITYIIIDSGINHSSRIAAGIINPVVFRRMALSWRVDDFLPVAKSFYAALEHKFSGTFLHPIPIRRAFAHQQEVDLWKTKEQEESHQDYLEKLENTRQDVDYMKHPYGTGVVKESYWVDTKALLDAWHQDLQQENKLIYQRFDYDKLDLNHGIYTTSDASIAFEKVIFCEGYHGLENPFFNYLPLQATKGELLTVRNEYLPENESLNYKCFVLPVGNKTFKIGATYKWDSPNIELTNEARIELEGHAKNLLCSEFSVLHHEAGVRPTVLDRRPLVGQHPNFSDLYIYNGLGAKGYLITPKLSEEFIDYLVKKTTLDKEIDIKRYKIS